MNRYPNARLLTSMGLLVVWGWSGASIHGADLRTSVGERPLNRQVSYTYADPADEPSVKSPSDVEATGDPDGKAPAPEPAAEPAVPGPSSKNSAPSAGRQSPTAEPRRSAPAEESYLLEEDYTGEIDAYGRPVYGYPDSCVGAVCGPCITGNGFWVNVDALTWWRRERAFPALVTTSPDATAFVNAGVLPGATVLFGSGGEGGEARPGGRIHFGTWLDPCQSCGVGGRFFALGDETLQFNGTSNGSPILAIPFYDEILNRENALVVAYPNAPDQRTGGIGITSNSEVLGADAYLRFRTYQDGCRRIDFVAGYQMSRIDEDLIINATSTVQGGGGVAAFRQDLRDIFAATNEFHGGTVGWMTEFAGDCWKLNSLVKVGFGNMKETVAISGQNTVRTPPDSNNPVVLNEGLFAQSTNIGRYSQSEFTVVPEINVNWVCHVSERLDVNVGYSFLYWSNAVQPGNHIDRRINETAAEALPQFQFRPDAYWVSGINLGAQFRF